MGRKITDGLAIDVAAPAATLIEKGELYRIDGWSGFAMDQIDATEVDRNVALHIGLELWRCKVPAGTCATRGNYVYWTAGAGFKTAATQLANAAGTAGDQPVAKVEGVRNSGGYATLRLVQSLGPVA